jgi:hypothetical protein
MRFFAVAAGALTLMLWAPSAEAACSGPGCRAGKASAQPRRVVRPHTHRVQRLPLRPYDGDQGGSYRPSFGCNVMGCD